MGIPEWEEERPSVEEGMSQEFTPTLEEFIYSWAPSNMMKVPRTTEEMFYWDVKIAIATVPTFVRTAIYMRAGMTFAEAGYAATHTYGAYRHMQRGARAASIVRALATGPGMVAAAAAASAHYVHTNPAPTEALRSEPGETSWWRSVAQALTGIGPGIGGADLGL